MRIIAVEQALQILKWRIAGRMFVLSPPPPGFLFQRTAGALRGRSDDPSTAEFLEDEKPAIAIIARALSRFSLQSARFGCGWFHEDALDAQRAIAEI